MNEIPKFLAILSVCGIAMGCEGVHSDPVPSYSTDQLCAFLGPNYVTRPDKMDEIRRELGKRGARCAGGVVTDYGTADAPGRSNKR